MGVTGVFLAAMMAGLNSRVGALALADVGAAHGFAQDASSWLDTVYLACELFIQPFACWFAVTLSLRRYEMLLIAVTALLALLLPVVHSLPAMLVLRGLQGTFAGGLIPTLMMSALRFLPITIRLHGLALYAMTATLAPNIAIWVAGAWTDQLHDWRLIYWQVIPLAALAFTLCAWGLPRDPAHHGRFNQGNWFGHVCLGSGLILLVIGLTQGVRLEWFHSHLITATLAGGLLLIATGLYSEWHHPSPFVKLQLLERRNLGLGFTCFVGILVLFLSGSMLPAAYLAHVQDYRDLQSAPIGLIIGVPQLILGPLVALALYRPWIDARKVFAAGLAIIAIACWMGSHLNSSWALDQFIGMQILQAIGQPMAVVSLLFLATSVVKPPEGPFVAGTVNMLRAFGTTFGSALIGQLMLVRSNFHSDMLLGDLADNGARLSLSSDSIRALAGTVAEQASVMATADAYRVLGVLAVLLIPLVLNLNQVAPPVVPPR